MHAPRSGSMRHSCRCHSITGMVPGAASRSHPGKAGHPCSNRRPRLRPPQAEHSHADRPLQPQPPLEGPHLWGGGFGGARPLLGVFLRVGGNEGKLRHSWPGGRGVQRGGVRVCRVGMECCQHALSWGSCGASTHCPLHSGLLKLTQLGWLLLCPPPGTWGLQ